MTVLLTSCAGLLGGDTTPDQNQGGAQNGTDDQPKPDDTTDDNKTQASAKYDSIIYADSAIFDTLADVRTRLMSLYGPIVTVTLDTEAVAGKGEVVFGDTTRSITAKAKAALESELSRDLYNDCGYIIYAEGGSVAVYWQLPDMAELAIAAFVAKCVDEAQLVLTDGVVFCDKYEKRAYEAEKYWLAIEMKGATEDELKALRNIYSFFDGTKMAGWMANLYDPEIGGFYYSNSARDTEGYLPDIESTAQLLSTAIKIGALNNRNDDIPNEIKAKIVEFAKNLQSSKDGYFYHPQWPQGRENLNTDRYGRDLGNATGVITSFYLDTDGDGKYDTQQRPNWCAPNGTKCALHNGTDEKCSFPIATSYYADRVGTASTTLTSTVSSAVSKITSSTVKAVVSQHPDYTSREAFSAWLEEYNKDIKLNSGNAHNLSAIMSEITQHGYSDIVLDHLDRAQAELFEEHLAAGIEPTGLWQTEINYRLVWGMLKNGVWYNNGAYGRAIDVKYIPYIIKSCTKVTALPPDLTVGYRMNDLYNQWTSITQLISNVKKYNPDQLQYVYSLMHENAPSLINNSLEKIKPFKCEDGSIIYQSSGVSMTSIYGTPIALGVREGDVNAMALCVGLYGAIFESLGYSMVPLCTEEDREMFIDTLVTCEPIEKNPVGDGTYDFEDGISSGITFNALTTDGKIEIVEDPEDRTNSVLYFEGGTSQTSGDTLKFKTGSHGSSCYIFETDIYVDSNTDDGYIFQIQMSTKYMIGLFKSGDTRTVKDIPSASHMSGQITRATFDCDEWHTLRFEYYVTGESTNTLTKPKIKIWLDTELVAVSDNYYGSDTGASTDGSTFATFYFYAMKVPRTYIYLDNLFLSTDDKVYDPNDDSIFDYRG